MRPAAVIGMLLLCGIAQGAEPPDADRPLGEDRKAAVVAQAKQQIVELEKQRVAAVKSRNGDLVFSLVNDIRLAKIELKEALKKTVEDHAREANAEAKKAARKADIEPKTVTNTIGMELIEIPAGKFMMDNRVAVTLTKREQSSKLKVGEVYRLPTDAEWEYACRAGTTTAFSFGDDGKQLGQYAWFDGNAASAGEKYAHAVGLKKPNPWGLHDMHGNVKEWCSDWYAYPSLPGGADPTGPGGGSSRVLRGSGWGNSPGRSSASRESDDPSLRLGDLGFRVARSQSAQ